MFYANLKKMSETKKIQTIQIEFNHLVMVFNIYKCRKERN